MGDSSKQENILNDLTDDVMRATDVLTQRGPVKQVRGDSDLVRWVRSHAYCDLIGYINNTGMALRGHRLNGHFPVSDQMRRLCDMFDVLERLLVEHASKPLDKGDSYRMWLRHMFQIVLAQLAGAISADKCQHIHELGEYLRRSFGNASSLDFGPGNELMFLFYLCGLFRSGILQGSDTVAAALMLFYRYIHLVRRLVTAYGLPMATNPRCSIEDYFVVPYIWGAAQLSLFEPFSPPQCDQPKVLELHRQEYMIVNLIENLPQKGGQLSNNAFQLWCILSVPTWPQVYRGIERCYINHVLASFHTVENAIFWELMSFDAASTMELLHRPSLGQYYMSRRSTGSVAQASGYDGRRTRSVSFSPVRTYVSLDLVAGLQDQQKLSEEESEDSDDEERLAMPHPSIDTPPSAHALRNVASDSSSSLSTETKFFMSNYD